MIRYPVSRWAALALLVAGAHAPAAAQEIELQATKLADVRYPLAVSPDGRHIAVEDPQSNLAILDVATGETRVLTTRGDWPEMVADVAFSPDGERVAYVWHNEHQFAELRLIGTDGSGLRQVLRDSTVRVMSLHDWSPDGEHVLITLRRYDSSSEVTLVPVNGGPRRDLPTLAPAPDERPRRMFFSPDGRQIAYEVRAGEGWHDILLTPSTGETPIPLVQHEADDRLLGWAPDGRAIVFASDRNGTVDIWLLGVSGDAATGEPELIRRDVGQMIPFSLGRDGAYYFAVVSCECHVYVAQLDSVTGAPRPNAERIARSARAGGADWSPDGRRLAYVAAPGGVSAEVWRTPSVVAVRSMDTGEERRFPVGVSLLHQLRPFWSPDGRQLLLFGWDADAYPREVAYAVDVETGAATTLLESRSLWDRMFEWLTWSADGSALFYGAYPRDSTTGRMSTIAMVKREVGSGNERELFRRSIPPYLYGFTASPDGNYLAFATIDEVERKSTVSLWSLARDEERVLAVVPLPAGIAFPAWDPRSRYVLYRSADQLWRVPVDGGGPESLGPDSLARYNRAGLSVHPNGQRVAFVAEDDNRSEVWVIRGLLPRP